MSVDPLAPEYPWYTPYQFAGNMPIIAVDLDGLEPEVTIKKQYKGKDNQLHDKTTFRDKFRHTAHTEKTVTIHNAKMYVDPDIAKGYSKDAIEKAAKDTEADIIAFWGEKSHKNDHKRDAKLSDPTYKLNIVFDGGIQVVDNIENLKSDLLLIVTKQEVITNITQKGLNKLIDGGSDADALHIGGGTILLQPSHVFLGNSVEKKGTPGHELGHWAGMVDNGPNADGMASPIHYSPNYVEKKIFFGYDQNSSYIKHNGGVVMYTAYTAAKEEIEKKKKQN